MWPRWGLLTAGIARVDLGFLLARNLLGGTWALPGRYPGASGKFWRARKKKAVPGEPVRPFRVCQA